jgi:hypothetical protein
VGKPFRFLLLFLLVFYCLSCKQNVSSYPPSLGVLPQYWEALEEEVPGDTPTISRIELLFPTCAQIWNQTHDLKKAYQPLVPYHDLLCKLLLFQPGDSLSFDSTAQFLIPIVTDSAMQWLVDSVRSYYSEQYPFSVLFAKALHRWNKEFQDFPLKHITTIVYGYDYSRPAYLQLADQVSIVDSTIVLGLHYFLGVDCPFYHPELPAYMRRRCRPESILPRVFRFAIQHARATQLTPADFPTLLDYMIDKGIELYVAKQILQEVPDSELIYYTASQWEWATTYERELFQHLVPLLYSQDFNQYKDYVLEGPFTKPFGRESAPRIAEFLGWRIVSHYMKRNPGISLSQLLRLQKSDYPQLFENARYKP